MGCVDFSLRLPLVPPVLTADVPLILMSILWEAAFPGVSYYTLQGYLYT